MKEFILRSRKASTNPGFPINELPRAGKMDAVCASISSALFVSGDVRRDTIFHAVLEGPSNGPKAISFFGNEIKGLHHDERSLAVHIQNALAKGAYLKLNEEVSVRPGVRVAKKSFERLLYERRMNKEGAPKQVIMLDPSGKDVREFRFEKDFVLVFGSAEGLPPKTLKGASAEKVSLGPRPLFAAHCPVIVHNELDRRIR
jgi:tRNA (pseudouridine54-N1)-methyltransferase